MNKNKDGKGDKKNDDSFDTVHIVLEVDDVYGVCESDESIQLLFDSLSENIPAPLKSLNLL